VLYELAWEKKTLGNETEAAETFERLAKDYAKSPLAAKSLFLAGEHYYSEGDFNKAANVYFAAQDKGGKTSIGENSSHKLAWSYYKQEDFERAHDTFAYQLRNWPDGDFADDAQVMLGESLFRQDKHEEALAALTKAIEGTPSSPQFKAVALMHAGQSAGQLAKWQESLDLLTRLITEHPDSPYKEEARYESARAYQELGQTEKAQELYEVVADGSSTLTSARARFMAGELHFSQKDYREAIRDFFKVAYGYGYPESPAEFHKWQADATFEAARCCELIERPDTAKKLYTEVVEKYPNSNRAGDAKQKLATLGE